MKSLPRLSRPFTAPLVGFLFALGVGMGILSLLGENPSLLIQALYNVCFTDFGLGFTLFYTTPLVLTGLSVALAFHAGLFNIGAEGQLHLGAVGVVCFALTFPSAPIQLALPGALLSALVLGGLWGALAGVLKVRFGSHEVVTTILLNFVAILITSFLILYPLRNLGEQNPETRLVPDAYLLPKLHDVFKLVGLNVFATTPVNLVLFFAIFSALVVYLLLYRTSPGFEVRVVGKAPRAAGLAGIRENRLIVRVFFLSGGLAGLVGINEVMGHNAKLVEGFSPQYGFTGIAVALLARNHPLGVLLTAFLFGALHNSSREIEFLSDRVSKDITYVLQAVLIGFIAANWLWQKQSIPLKKWTQTLFRTRAWT